MIALPGIVYLLINNYVPMFGVFLAFKNYSLRKGVFGSDWCGLQNFEFLFKTKDAWIMTRNTILYNVAFIVIGTIVAIAIAVMMCELGERKRVKIFQASLLLPNLLSWVVIGFIAYAFLNADTGFINKTILAGLGLNPVSWYSYTGAWPAILIIVNYGKIWDISQLYIWQVSQVSINLSMKRLQLMEQPKCSRSLRSPCRC